jgi:monoamine oxidase
MMNRRNALLTVGAAALGTARPVRAAARPDVLIVGAGLSGLYAAQMLEQAGMKVQVIEGSDRVGGRCMTRYDLPGQPEFGASQIGAMYARVRAMAGKYGVPIGQHPANMSSEIHMLPMAISLNQKPVITVPWKDSPQNPLHGDERAMLPDMVYPAYVAKAMPLTSIYDWYDPKFSKYDAMSLHTLMAQTGASPAAIGFADYDVYADSTAGWSALDALRKNYYYGWEAKHGAFDIALNGTSSIPNAMAAHLATPVALNKMVTSISQDGKSVSVQCEDGTSYHASFMICTLPFSTLRHVTMNFALPPAQRRAIDTLDYSKIVTVWVRAKRPFWKEDGGPTSLWSDGPAERMFTVPSRVSDTPNMSFYVRGAHGMKIAMMPPAQAFAYLSDTLAQIRPSTRGALEFLAMQSWPRDKFHRGAYAYFKPGQINDFGQAMAQPCGHMHFAGEHTARLSAGMEAACESGERAASEILGV